MVKLFTYCVLLSSLLVGCSAGIVDPPSVEPTNASGYFWPSNIDSASYSQKSILGGATKPFTLNFEHGSATFTQVSDNNRNEQFTYRITDEGIYLDNLTKVNPFIPLPEGFTLDSAVTTYITTFRKMKKVLVAGESTFLAVDADDSMFVTTDGGATWTNLYWAFDAGISAWVYREGLIYAGTHDGRICVSSNFGLSWEVIIESHSRSPITAIAVAETSRYVYYATKDSVLASLDGKDPVLAAKDNLGKSVTSLATTGNIQEGYILSASTEGKGIWTAIVGDTATEWSLATPNWTNCYELVAVNDQTLYALANIGGQVKLITSTEGGFKWTTANTGAPEGGPSFLAFTEQSLLAVTKKGLTTSYNIKNIAKAPQPSINATEVNDLSGGGGIFAVATDSGIFTFNTNSLKWQNVSSGSLVETTRKDAHVKGSLLLLKAGANSLDAGSTWDAGTAHGEISGAISTYYITAKVSEAINEFSLETLSGNTYTDVLPVQYIFSKAANSTNVGVDTYRLIIYYAKGVGPVYIQNYLGQVLLSEMYRN